MKLDMMGVVTNKFDTMLSFYRDVLGLEITLEMEHYVEFDTGGTRFAITSNTVMHDITDHDSFVQNRAGQSFELAFRVSSSEEVDETYCKIVERGATPIKSAHTMAWGQRAAFFADPDGNIHEIFADLK